MRAFAHFAALALAAAGFAAAPTSAGTLAGENEAAVAPIAGVAAPGAEWERVWSGPMTADGMAVAPDGALLFAQEQSNAVWKLWPDGRAWVAWPYVAGAGAVSVDAQGRVYAVERACSDPGLKQATCAVPSRVVALSPKRMTVADKFVDGSALGRLNDLIVDGKGGAYFTQGALYHTTADGAVSTIYKPEAFTNGLALSPDGKTLYVTDRAKVVAFDVAADGAASNQRLFATLDREPQQSFGGDGMAVDAAGRVYVTGDAGIYVFDPGGKELGVIPAPRRAITLAFAGPDRQTLYIGAMGAVTPEGEAWQTPEGVRNVAMTIYRLPVLAAGLR